MASGRALVDCYVVSYGLVGVSPFFQHWLLTAGVAWNGDGESLSGDRGRRDRESF